MFKHLRPAFLFAAAAALPQLALAHAVLLASTPKAGGLVIGDRMHIDLKFNSRVDGPHCTLALVGPDGKARSLVMGAQGAPDEISSDADGLHKGAYTLRWQALASDGHITRGSIPFHVG